MFFKIVKASFGQRRKTLLNSLTSMGILDKTDISAVLSVAGIDEKRRGETLSLEEFARLSDCMHSRIKELQKC